MKMVLYIPVLQSEAETCQSWQLSESHQDHNGQQHSSAPGDREKEPFDFYAVMVPRLKWLPKEWPFCELIDVPQMKSITMILVNW